MNLFKEIIKEVNLFKETIKEVNLEINLKINEDIKFFKYKIKNFNCDNFFILYYNDKELKINKKFKKINIKIDYVKYYYLPHKGLYDVILNKKIGNKKFRTIEKIDEEDFSKLYLIYLEKYINNLDIKKMRKIKIFKIIKNNGRK